MRQLGRDTPWVDQDSDEVEGWSMLIGTSDTHMVEIMEESAKTTAIYHGVSFGHITSKNRGWPTLLGFDPRLLIDY